MSYKIVIDSCGDFNDAIRNDGHFVNIPLTLEVEGHQIIDDDTFDQKSFLREVADSPNAPKSACPAPEAYKVAFETEEDHIYGITLSAALSGSWNSAMLGRSLALEDHPGKKIHVFNSKSACVGQTLIGLKIQECEEAGMSFEDVVETVDKYIESEVTWFVLESLEALRKNGRLSNLKARLATALNIKPVMQSTPEGEVQQLGQARGINKALVKMVDSIVETVEFPETKVLGITHCNCPERAQMVADAITSKIKVKEVLIVDAHGVSSLYASDGGIVVCI